MPIQLVRKRPLLLVATGMALVVMALLVGLIRGPGGTAHAVGQFAIQILNNGQDLNACTPSFGCTPEVEVNACHQEGNSGAFACHFQLAPHPGGVIAEDNQTPCFLVDAQGGQRLTFNSHVVYAPSGEVNIRCDFGAHG